MALFILGWMLYALSALLALSRAYQSFMSYRGMLVLVTFGPASLLALLSVTTGAVTWPLILPVAVIEAASWFFQRGRRRWT